MFFLACSRSATCATSSWAARVGTCAQRCWRTPDGRFMPKNKMPLSSASRGPCPSAFWVELGGMMVRHDVPRLSSKPCEPAAMIASACRRQDHGPKVPKSVCVSSRSGS